MGVGMARPKLVNMITCMEVGRALRYSLHDVFRALPFVPIYFYLYLEFELSEPLQFYLQVVAVDGKSSCATELFTLQPKASGYADWMGALPARVAGLLPGR
jgi:hypothetical protein